MATEDYKETMLELADNYLDLRLKFKEKEVENINFSFLDYVNFYFESLNLYLNNSSFTEENFVEEEDKEDEE